MIMLAYLCLSNLLSAPPGLHRSSSLVVGSGEAVLFQKMHKRENMDCQKKKKIVNGRKALSHN